MFRACLIFLHIQILWNQKASGITPAEKNATRYLRRPCLLQDVAQQTFTVQNKPAAVAPKETITHHFFVSGIGQKKTVDAAKICGGAENVVKTETQQTFVNGLLGFITLGIYTPLEARVYCSQYQAERPSIWATLSALLINILLVPPSCFCIVISSF